MAKPKKAGPVRLILTLGMAGLFSGLILVTIYLATRPLILRNQEAALEAAIYRVVPNAQTRKAFVVRDGELLPHEGTASPQTGEVIYGAYNAAGELEGFAIPAEGNGFQDTIQLIYGYNPETNQVIGMEVLESRETPGLGDKIIKDEHFLENFKALSVEPEIVTVKPGEKTAANQVDTISGATISSKAVVSILNNANRRFIPLISSRSDHGEESEP